MLARGGGLEPPMTGPEPVVLPITPPPKGAGALYSLPRAPASGRVGGLAFVGRPSRARACLMRASVRSRPAARVIPIGVVRPTGRWLPAGPGPGPCRAGVHRRARRLSRWRRGSRPGVPFDSGVDVSSRLQHLSERRVLGSRLVPLGLIEHRVRTVEEVGDDVDVAQGAGSLLHQRRDGLPSGPDPILGPPDQLPRARA